MDAWGQLGLDFMRGGRREEAAATAPIIALPGNRASRPARLNPEVFSTTD